MRHFRGVVLHNFTAHSPASLGKESTRLWGKEGIASPSTGSRASSHWLLGMRDMNQYALGSRS